MGLGQAGLVNSPTGCSRVSCPQWKSGPLVHLGWTATEDLLCIQEDGTVLIYNLFCEFKRHFSMGNVSRGGTGSPRGAQGRVCDGLSTASPP